MFGNRRRRAASNSSLNGSNANPSATTAAAQAFLKNRSSNASLSSAAAAAALRSRPTTPTSVADVQTKRTMRRTGSTSSIGSSASARPQLERRGSSGSMSERSFRDPSPNRSSQPVPSAADAPPVPAIPQNMQTPAIPAKSHKRAASLEAPPLRVASPPPNKANGRGSSLGPIGMTPSPRRAGPRNPGLSSVSELTSIERPASRGSVHSVNFSLPTGSRPTSPLGQRRLTSPSPQRANLPRITSPTNQNLVYDPNTRSFLPAAEILAIEQRLYDAANKPVKKKKRVAPQQAAGTHLADGTVGGRPHGTAVDAMKAASSQAATPTELPQPVPVSAPAPVSEPAPAPAPVPKRKKKKVVVVSDSDSDQASYAPNSSDNDSDARPATFNTRAGALLAKKPSIVREDREREEEEDTTPRRAKVSDSLPKLDTSPASARPVSPTPLPRSSAGRGHGRGQASASAAFAQGRQQGRSASQPAPAPLGITESIAPAAAKGSVRGSRVQSVSPARTTHFKETTDNLQVKHQPPPRSISPRKSALKNPSTPRGPSPSDNESVGVAQTTSETSEELSVPRKKANRVSFDETNVVVGQAATPVTTDSPLVQSPQQAKRPWYSIGRGKKKDTSAIDDVDDEIMKPRPALPSFGSVRGKKEKPQEEKERPLVRPAESTESDQPSLFTTPGEVVEQPLGPSNDHVVGSLLSQDAASKNAANISKSREPLPPQVTSVEGTGYNSETNSSTTSVDVPESALAAAKVESGNIVSSDAGAGAERSVETTTPIAEEKEESHEGNGTVPEISVLQATPTLEETVSRREWPDMPGGWRNSNSHSDSGSQEREEEIPAVVEHHVTDPTPADVGIAEPAPSTPRAGSPALGDIAAENAHAHPVIVEEPEESDASIYSDAAEDLSDVEGDGFMSLNAVVESPVVSSFSGLNDIPEPDSPTPKATKERAYRQSQLSKKSSEPDLDEGWDKAQEYWKGLSADKKRQLEEEARAEAEAEAEGSDTEVEAKPTPKPKKKKKVKTALPPATEPRQVIPQNERSYMIPPGSKAGPNGHAPMTMRSSMRAEPVEAPVDTLIRKSMRGPASKRGSLRAEEPPQPKGALQKKHRPMSYPPNEFQPDQALVDDLVKKMSKAGAGAAPAAAKKTTTAPTQRPAPTLRRRGSGDSDSSFKRARSGSNNSEIPNFRRSMRGSTETNNSGRRESPAGSSRFSLRSLSPTGSTMRRPFNNGNTAASNSAPTHMRMSMRNSGSYGPTPTMRGSPSVSRAKSPLRIPGFGRSASAKPLKQNLKPKKSSRFADSSDEEDSAPAFRSRFVDSSDDEDEPLPPRRSGMAAKSMRASAPDTSTPIRGIPKRAGVEDGDSSDLPDSDDEKPKSPRPKTPQNGTALNQGSLRRSGSGRGTISPTTTTTITASGGRPPHARRGSIMSILRRKKPEPGSKVRKSEIESAARRDTPLERSKSDLAAVRRPQSPKLQKRNPMSRENSASWPLPIPDSPPKIVGGEDGRPFSADAGNGVVGSESKERPDMGNRRFTATGLSGVDINGVLPEGGRKKKKFGALRRMFRLDD